MRHLIGIGVLVAMALLLRFWLGTPWPAHLAVPRSPSRQCNGATVGKNRIIAEFSMPAHEAFDSLPITNLGRCRLGLFCRL